ncbi:hypothetical protein Tco_1486801 [Tanacetum coccineum]
MRSRGDDAVELSDEESSNPDDENLIDKDEVAEIFRIKTNVFNFETHNGVLEEPTLVEHFCELFLFKNAHSEWPTYSWKDDGYRNGENLHGAYTVGNILRYQDLEWYKALKDGKLKDEALKNKAIMEGIINEDDESNNEVWRRWDDSTHNHEMNDYMETDKERCNDAAYNAPVFKIRRFEMIKYSFGQDEEYVAIKECEYDDLKKTNEDACRAY